MRKGLKIFSIIAVLCLFCGTLVFSLSACGKEKDPPHGPQAFSVEFYDEDKTTLLKKVDVVEDDPVQIETSKKEPTAYISYTFSKWIFEDGSDATESLASVKSDLVVYASFVAGVRKYAITFYNEDTVVFSTEVEAGGSYTIPQTNIEPKVKVFQDGHIEKYAFKEWVDNKQQPLPASFESILSDIDLFASFSTTPLPYSLTFTDDFLRVKHGEGTFISADQAWQIKLHNGSILTIDYELPAGYTDVILYVYGARLLDAEARTYQVFDDVEIYAELI